MVTIMRYMVLLTKKHMKVYSDLVVYMYAIMYIPHCNMEGVKTMYSYHGNHSLFKILQVPLTLDS